MNKVSIFPIMNLPEFDTGHEIVEELIKSLEENKISLEDTDVIVITQKIISKVEGRKIDINKEDIEEVIKSESLQIIRKRGETVIAKTKHGFICANAGIDKSNIEEGSALLLPEDPDKTSRVIRKKIEHKTGKKISVIICDTFGRAWRKGQTNVAIGSSGIEPLESYIGEKDTFNNYDRYIV